MGKPYINEMVRNFFKKEVKKDWLSEAELDHNRLNEKPNEELLKYLRQSSYQRSGSLTMLTKAKRYAGAIRNGKKGFHSNALCTCIYIQEYLNELIDEILTKVFGNFLEHNSHGKFDTEPPFHGSAMGDGPT